MQSNAVRRRVAFIAAVAATAGPTVPTAVLASTAPVASSAMAATVVAPLTYTPYQAGPLFSGATQAAYWLRPGALVVRDNQGAHDLLLLGHTFAGGSPNIHLATSQDRGVTWAFTASASSMGLGNVGDGDGVEYAAQDSTGNLHFTFKLASGSVYYLRCTPTRDGNGHVTGYTGLTTGLDITALTGPSGGSYRGSVHVVTDGAAAERLVVCVGGDGANSGQYVWVAKASSLTPAALSDFSDLSGTASSMTLALNQATAGGGIYDHAYGVGQLGATKDLYIFCASLGAEAAPTVATDLVWVRLTSSGSTWTVGSTATYAVTGGCWFGGVAGTANYVWVQYLDYNTCTPRIRRVNSAGTLQDPGFGSPSVATFTTGVTGMGTLNVHADETRLWTVFTRDSTVDTGGWGTYHVSGAFWNGAAWTLNTSDAANAHGIQSNAQAFAYGLSGLVDPAFDGVVGVQSNCQGTSFSGTLAIAATYTGGQAATTVTAALGATAPVATSSMAVSVTGSTVTATLAATAPVATSAMAVGVVDFVAALAATAPVASSALAMAEGAAAALAATAPVATSALAVQHLVGASLAATAPVASSAVALAVVDFVAALSATAPAATSALAASVGSSAALASTAPVASSALAVAEGAAASLAATAPVATSSMAVSVGTASVIATLAATAPVAASVASVAVGEAVALSATAPVASSALTAAQGVSGALAATAPVASSAMAVAVGSVTTAALAATAPTASSTVAALVGEAASLSSTAPVATSSMAVQHRLGAALSATAPVAEGAVSLSFTPPLLVASLSAVAPAASGSLAAVVGLIVVPSALAGSDFLAVPVDGTTYATAATHDTGAAPA